MHPTNFNVRTRIDKKTKIQHLFLEGDLGINYIDKIKTKIESISIESNEIEIELKKIESFDLSTVQLVYSLKKSLGEKGNTVKIISDMPEDIIPILKNAGFNEFVKS
jgi:ABC-type transporter Mla MlaB component